MADRAMASTLTANPCVTARRWAASEQCVAPPALALALVCSFSLYGPSKLCEITGSMHAFLLAHSLWHYVPCSLASLWIIATAWPMLLQH